MARAKKKSGKKSARPQSRAVSASTKLAAVEKAQRERLARWEAAVASDTKKRRAFARTLEGQLVSALEAMQDRIGGLGYRMPRLDARRPSSDGHEYERGVRVTEAGRRDQRGKFVWRSPWALIGKLSFSTKDTVGYADLYRILSSLTTRDIEKRVDGDRFARIRVEYTDGATGAQDEYTLSETFAWQYGIRRAIAECDPERARSLAARYRESVITAITIWFSSSTQRGQSTFVRKRP